ncbi:ryncolin-1 isoform X1 [Drosophila busckii]|uniref:ryncolin-1 isoform X1 n=1 Tax=Drosophila busckii TaxID=30019 RepID=UPI00083F348D|nr:ryncolin-1 isoform X1 [Drosophila busckii]
MREFRFQHVIEIMILIRIIVLKCIQALGGTLHVILVIKCEEQSVQHLDRLGNLTVKYGTKSEIHFEIKDNSREYMELQIKSLRAELEKQNELLRELNLKSNCDPSLASRHYPSCCAEATALSRQSGVYLLQLPSYSEAPFIASCDEHTQGGGWTVVLRLQDGIVDFYLFWQDYKQGIGNVHGEFFIGLDKLYALTKNKDQELLIVMENNEGVTKYAKYSHFGIDDEQNNYKLSTLGVYSGDAGDSLKAHVGYPFSARDRDNDSYAQNCAEVFTGGWWYVQCHASNLMGKYNDNIFGKGIN